MKRILLTILIFSFLSGCGSVTEGFQLKKGSTGDEFLVEKKNPLVLPPEFSELPQPKSSNTSNENEEVSFETKILSKDSLGQKDNSISEANSTEDFTLKNIRV